VPRAQGVVLEIGIGSGLNLPFYDAGQITKVIGLDPAAEITRLAIAAAQSVPFTVDFINLPGEEIPLADNSIDTILMTYTLCSIADPKGALNQMQRVLNQKDAYCFVNMESHRKQISATGRSGLTQSGTKSAAAVTSTATYRH